MERGGGGGERDGNGAHLVWFRGGGIGREPSGCGRETPFRAADSARVTSARSRTRSSSTERSSPTGSARGWRHGRAWSASREGEGPTHAVADHGGERRGWDTTARHRVRRGRLGVAVGADAAVLARGGRGRETRVGQTHDRGRHQAGVLVLHPRRVSLASRAPRHRRLLAYRSRAPRCPTDARRETREWRSRGSGRRERGDASTDSLRTQTRTRTTPRRRGARSCERPPALVYTPRPILRPSRHRTTSLVNSTSSLGAERQAQMMSEWFEMTVILYTGQTSLT